ncbi:hypothetical protein I317_00300 [Kwoniella heveanensis CBS 569]|nr:hypothetical protein I317_00300 [Kwoniella heveanensis CBS 569]
MFKALTLFLGVIGVAQAAQFTQPLRGSGPDPFVVYDTDTSSYLFMQTHGSVIKLTSAPTLGETGVFSNEKTVYDEASVVGRGGIWAPEIHKIDGKWHIYFTVEGKEVWVVSGGANPYDEYSNPTKLFDHYGIDGTVLKTGSGNYFFWCCHSGDVSDNTIDGSSICISPLTAPNAIDQGNVAVISRPDNAWEQDGGKTNEGPQPIQWNGRTYISYSASHCTTASYSLALLELTGSDPMNPDSWVKSDGPVFSSGNGEYGPGHNGIFISPDGSELWNVYHATTNSAGSCGDDRSTFAMRIATSSDSNLNFGTPVQKGVVTEGPSGEPGSTGGSDTSAAESISVSYPASSAVPLTEDVYAEAPTTTAAFEAPIFSTATGSAAPFASSNLPFTPVALVADGPEATEESVQKTECKAKRGKKARRAAIARF